MIYAMRLKHMWGGYECLSFTLFPIYPPTQKYYVVWIHILYAPLALKYGMDRYLLNLHPEKYGTDRYLLYHDSKVGGGYTKDKDEQNE